MAKPKKESGLTVSMIVRDERENLAELLPVVRERVDDVVLVDTGSTDGTQELARTLGARVFEQPWSSDFSAARNRGLEEVRTSHVLWLDADDRIEGKDLVRVRETVLEQGLEALMLLLVNESSDPNGVSSCWQLRVFPSRPEHRFEGRIHEQVRPSLERTGTPVRNLDVTIRHTGYVNTLDVLRKSRRNLELLRREIAEGRDDAATLYHLVKAASRCGELEEAAAAARRCVENPPAGTPAELVQSAAVMLGRMEFQRGRLQEAEQVLREAVERVPDDPLARFFLGDLLRQRGDLPHAAKQLAAARVAPVRNSTLPLPVVGLRRAIRLQLAEIREVLGQPAESATLYREILDEQPEDRAAAHGLARALTAACAFEDATKILERLDRSEPGAPDTLQLHGMISFAQGRDEEAERRFRRVEELQPRSWAAALHLGHLALRNGRVEESITHYERALGYADTPETRVGLAAAKLESGALGEALEHLGEAVDRCGNRPLPPGTEALSGEALLRLGRPGEAVTALERHLGRYGPDPRVMSRLADCYRELGAPAAARVGYQEALRLAPGLPEAVRGLEALSAVS